jgi:hypothetical protein
MIYLTTFFLTLFLTHIARALPRGCHDLISPETDTNQHDFAYGDTLVVPISSPFTATYDTNYDNPSTPTNNVACSDGQNGLASKYPTLGKFHSFPYVGGAFDIVWNSTNCGSCWKITNTANNFWIYVTGIDAAGPGLFNLATEAFKTLNNGEIGSGTLTVNAQKVSSKPCKGP